MARTVKKKKSNTISAYIRIGLAGILALAVPGLGHYYIGQRARGIACFIGVSLAFWIGLLVGGFHDTVNPTQHPIWFIGQVCVGIQAVLVMVINSFSSTAPHLIVNGSMLSIDVAVVYTGIAGMLNITVIFDAIARADRPEETSEDKSNVEVQA